MGVGLVWICRVVCLALAMWAGLAAVVGVGRVGEPAAGGPWAGLAAGAVNGLGAGLFGLAGLMVRPRRRAAIVARGVVDPVAGEGVARDGGLGRSAVVRWTPAEFERWCADGLRRAGWDAWVIGRRGDQGVDVLARLGPVVLALQCKRVARAVSNRSVQEVFAGKAYHGASMAAVVATGGFTASAGRLAERTGVVLLDASALELFARTGEGFRSGPGSACRGASARPPRRSRPSPPRRSRCPASRPGGSSRACRP